VRLPFRHTGAAERFGFGGPYGAGQNVTERSGGGKDESREDCGSSV